MVTIGRVIERISRAERGEAELAEEGIGAVIFVLLLAAFVVCIWQAGAAAAALKTHVFNNATAAALTDRLNTEAAGALSITVPANDVNGASNADGHEIAFFARSAVNGTGPLGKGEDLFWAYVYSPATSTVQEYKWTWNGSAFTTPVAYGAPFQNITRFVGVIVPATTRANPSSPYYMPIVATIANLNDVSCSYGFAEYPGSNRTVDFAIQAGTNGADGKFVGALGQPHIECEGGNTYIVGYVSATPSPCPVGWTGTAPNCIAPTPVPTPSPTPTPTPDPGGGGVISASPSPPAGGGGGGGGGAPSYCTSANPCYYGYETFNDGYCEETFPHVPGGQQPQPQILNGTEYVLLYDLQISGTVITAGNTLTLSSTTYTPTPPGPLGNVSCTPSVYEYPFEATLETALATTPGYIQVTNIEYGYTFATTPLPSPGYDVLPPH